MPTCRDAIGRAMRAIRANAAGESPTIDQMTASLMALQDLVGELHEARGALVDVDVPSSVPAPEGFANGWVANENTRVRIQAGYTVVVTLPNSVPIYPAWEPNDYGFTGWPTAQVQGSTGAADEVFWRAPSDGARIEIVGVTNQLFFYCADVGQWVSAYGLRLDDALPLNARYLGPFATLLAERVSEELALGEPTAGFLQRVSHARSLLFTRLGALRRPVRIEAF